MRIQSEILGVPVKPWKEARARAEAPSMPW